MATTIPTQIRIEEVKYPVLKPEVIEAMKEAKRINRDPNTRRYSSFSEALKDLDI